MFCFIFEENMFFEADVSYINILDRIERIGSFMEYGREDINCQENYNGMNNQIGDLKCREIIFYNRLRKIYPNKCKIKRFILSNIKGRTGGEKYE